MWDVETSNLFRKAHKAFKNLNLFSLTLVLISQIIASTVFPVIEASLRQVQNVPPNLLNFIYGLHILFAFYSVVGLYKIKDFVSCVGVDEIEQSHKKTLGEIEEDYKKRLDNNEQSHKEYEEELKQKLKQCSEDLAYEKGKTQQLTLLLTHLGVVQGGLAVLQNLLSNRDNNVASQEDLGILLSPLVQIRSEALGFTNNEMYNFAVYLADRRKQELHLFFRICDDRIERHDRPWKRGVGHVGLAFARNKTIISTDAIKETDILGEFPLPTDKQYYASFVCTPITGPDNTSDDPIGVFIITSSRPGHFSETYKLVAECFALILATYFGTKKQPPIPITAQTRAS